jgi:hypothetical protein
MARPMMEVLGVTSNMKSGVFALEVYTKQNTSDWTTMIRLHEKSRGSPLVENLGFPMSHFHILLVLPSQRTLPQSKLLAAFDHVGLLQYAVHSFRSQKSPKSIQIIPWCQHLSAYFPIFAYMFPIFSHSMRTLIHHGCVPSIPWLLCLRGCWGRRWQCRHLLGGAKIGAALGIGDDGRWGAKIW